MKISKIYYIVHSMLYSGIAADNPQTLRDTHAEIFLERELLCEQRWRAGIDQLPPDAIYAQLGGGPEILPYAKAQLGEDRVVVPAGEFSAGLGPERWYQLLTDSVYDQIKEKGHEIDVQTTQVEAWGESFEGCVYGYGTSLTRQLGLKHPTYVNFDMCVPDARFLCKAELITHFLLPGDQVRGYFFNGTFGFPMGVYLEGFTRQDVGNTGRIRLKIDNSKVSIEGSQGLTLYANLSIDRPDRKIPVKPSQSFEEITVTDDGLELPRGRACFIMGTHLTSAALLTAMRTATTTDG